LTNAGGRAHGEARGQSGTWFEARLAAGQAATKVDFVRGRAVKGRVRPLGIVPVGEQLQFELQRATDEWHERQQSRAFILQRADEPFDHCDTSRFAHGAVAVADAAAATPGLETVADELSAAIADEICGCSADANDHSAKEAANVFRSRLSPEQRQAHGAARIVIEDDREPPTEKIAEVSMGKQVTFYMTSSDEKDFLSFVRSDRRVAVFKSVMPSTEIPFLETLPQQDELYWFAICLWDQDHCPPPLLTYVKKQCHYAVDESESKVVQFHRSGLDDGRLVRGSVVFHPKWHMS
jgi:hypothetical protein